MLVPITTTLLPAYVNDGSMLGAAFSTTLVIDASGEKAGFIINVPKSGSITAIGFRTGAVTAGATLSVALQTVDLATGHPSGSNYGGSSPGSQVVTDTDDNTWFLTSLATPATAVMGDLVAVVIEFSGAAGNLVVSSLVGISSNQAFTPTGRLYTTSWAASGILPIVGIQYADGSYDIPPATYPVSAIAQVGYNTGTIPDEVALGIKLPFPCRAKGAWILRSSSGACNFTMKLYGPGNQVTASVDVDSDVFGTSRGGMILFPAPVVIPANTEHRLAALPTTSTSLYVSSLTFPTAALAKQFANEFYLSTRTAAGAWTNTKTNLPQIGLIIDQIDDGAKPWRWRGSYGRRG